jgi:hypothetical protein
MQITSAMMLNVIGRGGDVFANMRSLVYDNHEPRAKQRILAIRALGIYRTLRESGIVETHVDERSGRTEVRLTVDLQPNFALNQPLSPFALAAFELLDPAIGAGTEGSAPTVAHSSTFALDMLSIVEATLDDPRAILSQQEFIARGEAVAAMKREGMEYEERMEALEEITYPKPLEELLSAAFETFSAAQPWIRDFELHPKSVVRDMYERAMSFGEYVALYKIARSEGVVLRYLSDAYRAASQTIPEHLKSEELRDLIEWLGELVRQVDSSLLDEWEELISGHPVSHSDEPVVPPAPKRLTTNVRAFRILVRNELFRRVQLAAREDLDALAQLDPEFGAEGWDAALDAYFAEHDEIRTGADARSAALLILDETGGPDHERPARAWAVQQILDDPAGDHDWRISAMVDLDASDEAGEAVIAVTGVARL